MSTYYVPYHHWPCLPVASPLRLTSNTTRSSAFTRHLWSTRNRNMRARLLHLVAVLMRSPFLPESPCENCVLIASIWTQGRFAKNGHRLFSKSSPATFKNCTSTATMWCSLGLWTSTTWFSGSSCTTSKTQSAFTQSASSSPQVRFPCLNCISSTRFTKTSRFLWRKCEKEQT